MIEALLPRPLRAVDRAIVAISPPVRADEADTLALVEPIVAIVSSGHGVGPRRPNPSRACRFVGRWPGDESSDELEKRRYLDEVAATGFDRARIRADATTSHRVERIRRADVGDVAAALAADEPRTSVVLCRLRGRWPDRTFVVRGVDGSLACVVALRWLSVDVWTVAVYLADPLAAPLAARLVDRSPARSLTGTAADVDPLLPFLTAPART